MRHSRLLREPPSTGGPAVGELADEALPGLLRLGLPLALLLSLAGYFGPWVAHRAAALAIPGFDLAEYVKFLAEARSGTISVWRESFLLPAAILSVSLSLVAVNRRLRLPWFAIVPHLVASALAALSMLPPAWTPNLLLSPEFLKQTLVLSVCLGIVILSPMLRRLPFIHLAAAAAIGQATVAVGAAHEFLLIKPAIDRVYGTAPAIGWGFHVYLASTAAFLLATGFIILRHLTGARHLAGDGK